MYHCLAPEWPCLSFDILGDMLGGGRTRCVHIYTGVCMMNDDFLFYRCLAPLPDLASTTHPPQLPRDHVRGVRDAGGQRGAEQADGDEAVGDAQDVLQGGARRGGRQRQRWRGGGLGGRGAWVLGSWCVWTSLGMEFGEG